MEVRGRKATSLFVFSSSGHYLDYQIVYKQVVFASCIKNSKMVIGAISRRKDKRPEEHGTRFDKDGSIRRRCRQMPP